MTRSIKLGHCVCDPKKPCPCDTLRNHNVCRCAGEKMPPPRGPVRLTEHVRKAGCASKIPQADLLRILGNLPQVNDPNILIGAAAGDDAGVYSLDGGLALVQTVDVFTPCVDDPYLFGQIAAANSVSDVYAMGGKPLTALSIIGFPIEELDGSAMEAMLRGGMDKLAEAHCSLIGGHSINDPEIKFGFAVTGLIDASAAVARDCARPGDVLVLTKPIGTGIIAFANQLKLAAEEDLAAAGRSMAELNRDAAQLMVKYRAHACTDVTGFGLAGHLVQMVRGSNVDAEINMGALPIFPGLRRYLDMEAIPGAIERNQEYAMAWVHLRDDAENGAAVLYDPQTSGGLLVALPEVPARRFVDEMHALGHESTAVIGRVVEKADGGRDARVFVSGRIAQEREGDMNQQENPKPVPDTGQQQASCCDSIPDSGDSAPDYFTAFMKSANMPGLIDARAKKLMAIALSVAQRCEPCLKIHFKSALGMGITVEEIDEAAHLAIAFGGCTAMMFYKEIKERLMGRQ